MTVNINLPPSAKDSLSLSEKGLLRELIVQFSDFAVARYGVNSEQARISMCLADGLDPWIEPPLLCLPSHEQ